MRRAEVPPQSGRRRALGLSLLLALSVLAPGTTASESTALAQTVHRPARPVQPTASVTAVVPATLPQADQRETMTPAIRLGTAGTGRPTTEVRVSAVLLRAYRAAVDRAPRACHLPVSLLAAIGQVESGSLVGRALDDEHRTSILGPELDGMDFAAVADTDHGRWDGDTTWDRAVGPMQFLPGTWLQYGVDGDGDGTADPQDVEDAATSTAAYLCYGNRDLAVPAQQASALLAYNHSYAYLRLVQTYEDRYVRSGLDSSAAVGPWPTPANTATPREAQVRAGRAGSVSPTGQRGHRVTAASPTTRPSVVRRHSRTGPATDNSRTTSQPTADLTSGVPVADGPDVSGPTADGPTDTPLGDPLPGTTASLPAGPDGASVGPQPETGHAGPCAPVPPQPLESTQASVSEGPDLGAVTPSPSVALAEPETPASCPPGPDAEPPVGTEAAEGTDPSEGPVG